MERFLFQNLTMLLALQIVLFGGDWKQLLPVVELNKNESPHQVVLHSLKSWTGYESFLKLKLVQNQRTGEGEQDFAK